MSDAITTPCHGAELIITTRQVGSSYMPLDVPDSIMCSFAGCTNEWSRTGEPDKWNKPVPVVSTSKEQNENE